MRSNTDGWSNTQLNNRIEALENKLEAVNEWLKEELVMSPVNPSWYTKRIRKIADILEAKG